MDISTTRPKVAQLTFRLLGRSVHPELFQIFKAHRIDRQFYSANLHITSDGHFLVLRSGGQTLTEIAASSHQLIPSTRHILELPLRDSTSDSMQVDEMFHYRFRCGLERLPAEMFWMIQQQLKDSGSDHDLVQFFNASGRIPIGGVSFIHIDSRSRSLRIQAIHTFPDDLALVKTESTFTVLGE